MSFAGVDADFNGSVSENLFKEVIAQRDELTRIDGGRMIPPSAETIYNAGQVMAQYTSGANTGLWVPYDSANSSATDGSQTPIGVLYGGADVLPNGAGSEIRVITAGVLFLDLLMYNVSGVVTNPLSSAVATALGKKKIVHGQNLIRV